VDLDTVRPQRRCRNRHTVSPKHIHHLLAVRRTSCGGADYFRSFSEIRWSHDHWRYNGELFDILVTEIIEAVHRASRDTQGPSRTNLDWRAINRPGQHTLNTIKNLLVGVILVRRGGQLLPRWVFEVRV
jgi:hypothetical protein